MSALDKVRENIAAFRQRESTMAVAHALAGEWLSVDEAVEATVHLGLLGFDAFDVALWHFGPKPMRLKKKYRRAADGQQ